MTNIDPRALALGQEIRAEAAAQKISLRELSSRASVTRGSLYLYLDGERDMHQSTYMRICSVLGIRPYGLMRRAEERVCRNAQEG